MVKDRKSCARLLGKVGQIGKAKFFQTFCDGCNISPPRQRQMLKYSAVVGPFDRLKQDEDVGLYLLRWFTKESVQNLLDCAFRVLASVLRQCGKSVMDFAP